MGIENLDRDILGKMDRAVDRRKDRVVGRRQSTGRTTEGSKTTSHIRDSLFSI